MPDEEASWRGQSRGLPVEVRGVEKWYRTRRGNEPFCALSDVSLSIGPGEFISVIGASGCGKTTLLRVMAGLINVQRGQVLIGDQPVRGVPKNVGFVFQDPALLAWESVAQNVELGLAGRKVSREERERRLEEQLKLIDLWEFREYAPYQISGGMQQRVGLARALIGQPGVLFLDEPLGALDAFTRVRLQEELARLLADRTCTAVLVTHDVEEALFLSERIVVMSSGPGRVQRIVSVPSHVGRTRTEFLSDPDIVHLRAEILSMIVGA